MFPNTNSLMHFGIFVCNKLKEINKCKTGELLNIIFNFNYIRYKLTKKNVVFFIMFIYVLTLMLIKSLPQFLK